MNELTFLDDFFYNVDACMIGEELIGRILKNRQICLFTDFNGPNPVSSPYGSSPIQSKGRNGFLDRKSVV